VTDESTIDLFIRSQSLLHVEEGDASVTADNIPADLEAVAQVAADVLTLTANANSPFEIAVYRLALLTLKVVVTYVVPDREIVRRWQIARTEVLLLQLAAG
jgi:hypothetical protein